MKHVHIEVWDYKRLRKNKVIGCTSVEISDVISDAQVDQWYTLLEDTRSKRIISGEEAHEKVSNVIHVCIAMIIDHLK